MKFPVVISLVLIVVALAPPIASTSTAPRSGIRDNAIAGRKAEEVSVSAHRRPLVIKTAGVYTGSATQVTVAAGPDDLVIIDHLACDNIVCNNQCNLIITNCAVSGRHPTYSIVVWRFKTLVLENNLIGGEGILFRDFSGQAISARVRFNKGINISGATGPATRKKVSFIQAANLHIADMEIAWNWLQNTRGASATEDAISLLLSGGTPGHPALVHDNFVDGIFNWPIVTDDNHPAFTGSGIMCFDPGCGQNVTVGGYSKIFNNVVLACENQAFPMAGGHDIEIFNNRAVNDGTSTRVGTTAYQVWNWGQTVPATPANVFAANTRIHDNMSCWFVAGKRSDWTIDPAAAQANNVATASTEQAERNAWAAKLAANRIVIGPR
jgi:hypothetical protein